VLRALAALQVVAATGVGAAPVSIDRAEAGLVEGGPTDPPSRAKAQDGSWRFELPTLDGARFVRAGDFPGPVLLNFWGRDCPPCVAELPLLQDFGRDHLDWTVLLVATDAPRDAARFLAEHGIRLPVLRGGFGVAALMRRAGNLSGGLPFTVALLRSRICGRHVGLLQAGDLAAITSGCAARLRNE